MSAALTCAQFSSRISTGNLTSIVKPTLSVGSKAVSIRGKNRTTLTVVSAFSPHSHKKTCRSVKCRNNNADEWGSRDATKSETESGFNERCLGHADTEHLVGLPRDAAGSQLFTLGNRDCSVEKGAVLLNNGQNLVFLKQVWDWKIVAGADEIPRLRLEMKVKSFADGLKLFERVAAVAEANDHHPDLHLERWNNVAIEIYSHSAGGITENDFILAAKIDKLDTSDLVPPKKAAPKKQKFWA